MITASGQIGHKSILDEFGRATASNSLHQIVRFFNGKKQVLINSTWVDCNMCSPALPSHIAPHSIKDWYSYNHSATGVTGGSITGTTTVNLATAYTYGTSLTGGTTTGTSTVWYKYENGVWSTALATAPTVTITWTNPIGAKVKAVIINGCQGGTVEIEQAITYNCTNITTASVVTENTMDVNTIFTAYSYDVNGTTLGRTFLWQVFGNLQILGSATGPNAVIKATAAGGINVIKLTIGNSCNTFTTSDISIEINAAAPTVYWNTQQSKNIQKNNCASNQTGGYYTVIVSANTYSTLTSVADSNQLAIDYLNSQFAQDVANNNALCYGGGNQPIPNEAQSVAFTKDDCSSGTPSIVVYTVPAGAYTSLISQADANQKAIDFINEIPAGETKSRGQLNANTNGQCTSVPIYYSTERVEVFQKNDCGVGEVGSLGWITSVAGQYSSLISVADANAIRDADMQVRANEDGTCSSSTVYWNVQVEAYFQKQCSNGNPGSSHYYSIAANLYSSTVSQQAANDIAILVLNQQGQANANSVGSCASSVDWGKISVIAIEQGGGSPTATTIQLDNFTGSGTSCRIRYRRYISNPAFVLSWSAWGGWETEGSGQLYSYPVVLSVGTPVEVQIEITAGTIETRTVAVQPVFS